MIDLIVPESNNRLEITIKTNSKEEKEKIGRNICCQLLGNPDFIDNNIVVNFTDSDDCVYIIVGEEAKETDLQLHI